MVASTIREYYEQSVVAKWPDSVPQLSAVEAERAARRLYRYVFKKSCPYPVKITSGRNYSYIRSGTLRVNPTKGWRELVHELSHSFHQKLSDAKPHSYQHARLERDMVEYVVAQGWLSGKLQPKVEEKPKATSRQVRYKRTLDSIERWETKLKRAENALKKLLAKKRYYEKVLSD